MRTLLYGDPPKDVSKAKELIDRSLSIAQHAMRISAHATIGSSHGAIVFNHDMFLNAPLSSNWHATIKKIERLVNYRLMRQNKKDVSTIMPLINRY